MVVLLQFEYQMIQLDEATETLPARWLSMKSAAETLSLFDVGLPLPKVVGLADRGYEGRHKRAEQT